jgi:hypothetical protein
MSTQSTGLSHHETREASRKGWRVRQWALEAGISQASTWELVATGRIRSVKFGAARIITTSPEAFLTSLEQE